MVRSDYQGLRWGVKLLTFGGSVGVTGSVPRLGFRGFCLQDGPLGIRYSEWSFCNVFSMLTDLVQLRETLPSRRG
jgi:hypothetical protein